MKIKYVVSAVVVLLLVISGIVLWNVEQKREAAEQFQAEARQRKENYLAVQAKIDAANAKAKAEAEAEEKRKLATVRKGEGVEHSLIRQLISDPKPFGFNGDTSRKTEVKKWAGRMAHVFAANAGFFDLLRGAEIRVVQPGVAYVLAKTAGKLTISMFKVGEFDGSLLAYASSQKGSKVAVANQSVSPQRVLQVADHYSADNFIGLPGSESFLPSYEYLWIGFNPTTVAMTK